jgi:hypothetical protein
MRLYQHHQGHHFWDFSINGLLRTQFVTLAWDLISELFLLTTRTRSPHR